MSFIIKGIDIPENFEAIAIITKNENKDEPLYNSVASYYGLNNIIQIPEGAKLIDANEIYIGRWDIDTDLADQILNARNILESDDII